MSLIYCPECGHEISQAAIACPSCGRPINGVPVADPVIITRNPPREGFPLWAIVPLAIVGATLLFLLFYALGRDDETAGTNLNVNVNTRRAATTRTSDDIDRTSTETHTTTVPSTGTTVTTAPPPPPPSESQVVTVPGSQTAVDRTPTRGRVTIDAKVTTRNGTPQAVRNERFYLLDKDLESILSDADLEPIDGNSLANSFGLAMLYPAQHGDFYRNALTAIKRHIKYAGTTDGSGKAQLSNIEPDSYYLFGITKTGRGFAMWSNPVSIMAGENVLNLSPQPVTEMDRSSE